MATITSAGTGNSNATATWVGGVVPDADDDVVIDSGHTVTQNANATFNSLAVNGTFVASSSYSLTIDGERSNGRALDIVGTFTHGNGTITITTAADTDLRWPSSSEAYNITINHASCIARPTGDKPVIANNLTITAGTFNTLDSGGGSSHALTVTGTTTLSGNLTLNGSTASFNSGATGGGVILETGGHITGDADSTVTIGSISATGTANRGVSLAGTNTINKFKASDDLIINLMDGTVDGTTLFTVTTPDAKGIALQENTCSLTLNPSSSVTYNLEDTLNVNHLTINSNATLTTLDGSTSRGLAAIGDVEITGTLTGNASAISMGSLTINDGGTYNATSGTTTITDEGDGSGGTNGYAWYNVTGTYTHNNGTVEFTGNSDTDIREDAFYNLIINGATSSVDFYIRQKDGSSSSSGHIKIFNNLDIQRGGFQRAKSANELSVFGIIDICSGGTGGYFGDTSDTGIYNLGAVNIHNNGTLNLSNGDNNINSIRNIAGTVAQD